MFWRSKKTVFIRIKAGSEGRVTCCWYAGPLLVCRRLKIDLWGELREASGLMVLSAGGEVLGDDKLHWTPASGFKLTEKV